MKAFLLAAATAASTRPAVCRCTSCATTGTANMCGRTDTIGATMAATTAAVTGATSAAIAATMAVARVAAATDPPRPDRQPRR